MVRSGSFNEVCEPLEIALMFILKQFDLRIPEFDHRTPGFDLRTPEFDRRTPEFDSRTPESDSVLEVGSTGLPHLCQLFPLCIRLVHISKTVCAHLSTHGVQSAPIVFLEMNDRL